MLTPLLNGGRILKSNEGSIINLLSINDVEVNFFGFYRNLLYLTEGNTGFVGYYCICMGITLLVLLEILLLSSRDGKVAHISLEFTTFKGGKLVNDG
jgi:hypothetical protein